MKSPPDRSKVTLPTVALDLDELFAELAGGRTAADPSAQASALLVGEVLDTHHPHRPGRIFVRWALAGGEWREAWLFPTAQVRPRAGDRVLLQRPTNDVECIVTAVLTREPEPPQPVVGETAARIALHANEALRIEASDGTPLVEIESSAHGPVLRVLSRDLELAVAGRLRLSADAIECVSGQGGTEMRSDGETVVRARLIRLN